MWLKDDLEQLKQNWKQSPWWVRLWMVVSLFLAVSSFASLAETFANWKGFFLDAIEFYRSWISGPLRDFAAALGFRYTSQRADFTVLYAIMIVATLRGFSIDMNLRDKHHRWLFLALALMPIGALLVLAHYNAGNTSELRIFELFLCVLAPLSLIVFLARTALWARFILFQLVAVAVAVGVLGSISSGLSA